MWSVWWCGAERVLEEPAERERVAWREWWCGKERVVEEQKRGNKASKSEQ